jgi:hypothetical protein
MAREQDMKQTRKKHGAAFKAKVALAAIRPKRVILPATGIAAIPAVPGLRARPERAVAPGSFAELS